MTKHLQKVRLSASEKPADPCAALTGLTNVGQKRAQDTLDSVGVLSLADKRREFIAQFLESIGVAGIGDSRLALVSKRMGGRVPLQNILNLHAIPSSECSVIGTAR